MQERVKYKKLGIFCHHNKKLVLSFLTPTAGEWEEGKYTHKKYTFNSFRCDEIRRE